MLQSQGRTTVPLVAMFSGAFLKFAITFFTVPLLGVRGSALGTAVGFAFACLTNIIVLWRSIGPCIDLDKAVLRPFVCTVLMGAVLFVIQRFLPQRGGLLELAVLVAVGITVYIVALILSRSLTAEDRALLPGKKASG